MKIARIAIHRVRLPLQRAFETSSHRKTYLEHLIIRAITDDGIVGWGEIASPSDPWFSSETVDTTTLVALRYIAPALQGIEWSHPDEIEHLLSRIRGHEFAKAGFDMAAWTIYAQSEGLSLASALGGTRNTVVAGVSMGIEPTVDALVDAVGAQVTAGYSRVKLKIKPQWDVKPVDAVRRAFPEITLHVDANGVYPDDRETVSVMRQLDGMDLALIEQPFGPREFVASARLQGGIATPICLDESIVAMGDIDTMIALEAGRSINIKVSRIGGLSAARRMHDRAAEVGIPVWCGGMHEFGIGRAANVALSSLPNFTYPSDVSASRKYYERDIIRPDVRAKDGRVAVPTAVGLGFDVDEQWIAANTTRTDHLAPDALIERAS